MTILFYNDWQELGAFPDWNTTNRSAVRVATSLKRMGQQNHAFMLALYDRDLVGIDPFDPNLTIEMQAKITTEFSKNYWYAIRECIRIPPVAGIDAVQYKFHRANVALAWLYLARVFNLSVIARQRGKTMAVVALLTWLLNSRANMTISSITKDDELRASTVQTFRKVYEELPPYLQFRTSNDSRNTTNFTVNALSNIIRIVVSSLSPKRAYLAGRGGTTSTCWVDEICFVPNARIAVGTAIASGTFARDAATEMGHPSGVIMTTTAGRLDDPDGQYAYGIAENSTLFNEGLYDAEDLEELYSMIKSNNPLRMVRTYAVFNHLQLGITNAEQLMAIQMSTQSKAESERDFLSIWNHGNAKSTLPEHILNRIMNNTRQPDYWQMTKPENFAINWYVADYEIPHLADHPMVLALDPSDALGSDSMGLVLTSALTGQVMATSDISLTSIPAYTRWLYMTFIRPYPLTTTIIEARSSGLSIIDALIEMLIQDGQNPFQRLYNHIYDNRDIYPEQYEMVKPGRFRPSDNLHVTYKRYFGYKTSGSGQNARSVLYGELYYSTCERYGHLFVDARLCQQIAALVEKNGKLTHPAGSHDDLVIALLLSHFFLQRSKNLAAYGLTPTMVLRETVSKENNYEEYQRTYLLNMYRELLEQLRYTDNQWVRKTLIHKLRNMEIESPFLVTESPSTMRELLEEMHTKKLVDRAITPRQTRETPVFANITIGR